MAFQSVGLFCEDIREEKSGQITLVGILPDNINVPSPPPNVGKDAKGIIPKLGLYIRVHLNTDEDLEPMDVKLILPDATELGLGTIDSELIDRSKREAKEKGLPIAGILHHAVMQGFTIPGAGKMLAVLQSQKGDRHICAVLNFIPLTRAAAT